MYLILLYNNSKIIILGKTFRLKPKKTIAMAYVDPDDMIKNGVLKNNINAAVIIESNIFVTNIVTKRVRDNGKSSIFNSPKPMEKSIFFISSKKLKYCLPAVISDSIVLISYSNIILNV